MMVETSYEKFSRKQINEVRAKSKWRTYCKGLVYDEDITTNVERLSSILGVKNVTSETLELSLEDLNRGAELFISLNSCPSYWSKLFRTIFQPDFSTVTTILTLINIFKKTNVKEKATGIHAALTIFPDFAENFEYIFTEASQNGIKMSTTSMQHVKGSHYNQSIGVMYR